MRITSNKVSDLISFYKSELKEAYEPAEIDSLIQHCFKHYLNFNTSDLVTKKTEHINQSDLIKIYKCCIDLKKHKPFQYILEETEFFRMKFKVSPDVLIPRPETEELVELILKDCKTEEKNLNILDIGTGSGCIAIALKKNLPDADVFAVDVSNKALEIAEHNAKVNKAPVIFCEADILNDNVNEKLDSFDLIVSNPPYIAKSEADLMLKRVKEFEPHLALFVENNEPLIFYKKIIELCKNHLNENGKSYFELNPIFAEEIKQIAEKSCLFESVKIIKDLSGNNRFLKATKK